MTSSEFFWSKSLENTQQRTPSCSFFFHQQHRRGGGVSVWQCLLPRPRPKDGDRRGHVGYMQQQTVNQAMNWADCTIVLTISGQPHNAWHKSSTTCGLEEKSTSGTLEQLLTLHMHG
jgi:hypothetical protein